MVLGHIIYLINIFILFIALKVIYFIKNIVKKFYSNNLNKASFKYI
jgi:hypothetical protein